jgi:2-oxoisovalerate dehydrogenase E1 component
LKDNPNANLVLQEELGVSADILDLRTLLPWDKEAVEETVKKTGKVLVCHEDCLTGGIAGEIAAWIGEHLFTNLDAPVMRVGAPFMPVPFARSLEMQYAVDEAKVLAAMHRLLL